VYALDRFDEPPGIFGIIGGSSGASRSPSLHNHGFRVAGENALFVPLETRDAGPPVAWLRDGRLQGASVTMPFKEAVVPLLDALEPDAESIGAVNTIVRTAEGLTGANTDVEAAREMLAFLEPEAGLAVLGAGGAAAAVIAAGKDLGAHITLFNRTASRGEATASRFGVSWGGSLDAFRPEPFRALVNATPGCATLLLALSQSDWSRTTILDLAYGESGDDSKRVAGNLGASYLDGLDFLVRQATGQFFRWTGKRLPAAVLAEGLAA
jgi:shikimate dehydrogenase